MAQSRFFDSCRKDGQGEEELLNSLYSEMFGVAYAKMRNKADALDVVQESWVKILNKIDSLRDETKLLQWAKRIVSNTANNHLRHRSVRQEWVKERMAAYDADAETDPWEERFLRHEIRKGIGMLDEPTQQMFIYKYYYGMKDRQIAEKMKCPVGTVKARLHRGRDKLRSILADVMDE